MEEIYALADRITVLRDGVVAATGTTKDLDRDALVAAMLGRELRAMVTTESMETKVTKASDDAHAALEVRRLSVDHATRADRIEVRDATLSVARGEIVGVAGVEGSGASALLHAVFGSHARRPRGEVVVARARVPLGDPIVSVARGLALVPADRKAQGIVPQRSVRENAALSALRRWSFAGFVRAADEERDVASMMRDLHLVGALESPIDALSGGNQQKVVLARCLLARPRVLLLDEPTRGVDVGAKAEIHKRLRALADEGVAILFATTEIDDLRALCDRVLVMHRGSMVADLSRVDATRDRVLRAAMGTVDA
jgi:ABC-type sugar transport system ATPase subunit